MIPGHVQGGVFLGEAEHQVRTPVEALVHLARRERARGRAEPELAHRTARERALVQRHGAKPDLAAGVHADGLRHDLDVAANVRAREVAGEVLAGEPCQRQATLHGGLQTEHGIHAVTHDAAHGAGGGLVRSCAGVTVTVSPSLTAVMLPWNAVTKTFAPRAP